MLVTIRRFQYNNNERVFTKDSKIELRNVSGSCAADCMKQIKDLRYNNDLSLFSPWEIINIQD